MTVSDRREKTHTNKHNKLTEEELGIGIWTK